MSTSNGIPNTGAMNILDFCKWSGIGRTAVYEEINSGRLKVRKCGRRTLVPTEEAVAWLKSLPSQTA
ncbi:hypothetical protein [Azospirillum endophyticum]